MKVVQPFFLGGAGGLLLALAVSVGLFASPLRKALYLDWDPEISDLRGKMGGLQDRLVSAELGIAESESAPEAEAALPKAVSTVADRRADSLKASQAGSWKEYRHWRNRLGERSRLHDKPDPGAFPAWAYSLRYVLGPAALTLFLLPAGFLAWRGSRRNPSRPSRGIPRPSQAQAPRVQETPAQAMASLEAAVKQVARIAARNEAPPVANRQEAEERETEYLPEVPRRMAAPPQPQEPKPAEAAPTKTRAYRDALREDADLPAAARPQAAPQSPQAPQAPVLRPMPQEEEILAPEPSPYGSYEPPAEEPYRVPETAALPLTEEGETRPEGLETQIFNLGPGGWGEARRTPAQDSQPPMAAPGLSMEDEDMEPEETEPPPGAFMPPTTEVERVERRKAEVLKLARKGLTSSEISRRMRISQDQVDIIIRMRREKG